MAKNKKITKEDLRKIEKTAVRDEMKDQGALDGRFRPKVVPDKTKVYKRKKKHKKDENEE